VNPAQAAASRLRAVAADGRLDEVCQRHSVRVLGVLGSAARPTSKEPKDLDIAVGFLEPDRLMVLTLLTELTELIAYDNLDLVLIDGAEPLLRARAFCRSGPLRAHPGRVGH
jgi:predicted nucleotidyltransferase